MTLLHAKDGDKPGILVFFHCPSNSGYAITRLEGVFLNVARKLVPTDADIHFAYPDLTPGRPAILPPTFGNVIQFDPRDTTRAAGHAIETYVRNHQISLALGFDQPVRRPGYRRLRSGGVNTFVSYWGAPMSSLNRGWMLAVKRFDVGLAKDGPDHYVFESKAMRRTATEGRGVPRDKTSVTYLGVDAQTFRPADEGYRYAHERFAIPPDRRIIYYSGHMEERKGVHVLVRAAVELVDRRQRHDVHFLLLGNRPGEEAVFEPLFRGTRAEDHITFGGYRDDVDKIVPSAYVGAIASTGWDSFTMSSLEIAACGIPLVVSRLPGLDETVVDGVTGFTFPVGDPAALCDCLESLLSDSARRDEMGHASRARVLSEFTTEIQIESLVSTIKRVAVER